jgi:outer membrane protein OmpA-like peptidoglycan-associated protein
VLGVVLALLVTACASGNDPGPAPQSVLRCPVSTSAPMTILIGARANSTVPELPAALIDVLKKVADAQQQITLVRLDGRPDPFFREALTYTTNTGPAREDELNVFLGELAAQFREPALAKVPEADVLSALSLASRTTPAGGTVVMLDSGLQTVAPLDFRENDLLLAEPNDVADFLTKAELLPDLARRNLVLVGTGDTAAPQERLNDRLRTNLRGIWRTIGEAGSACVDDVPVGGREVSVEGVPTVSTVVLPVPPEPAKQCGDTVLGEQNNVGFLPDRTDFRDEAAARTEIGLIVDQARDGNQQIELIGTTARSGPRASQIDLAKRRANRVRDIMVEQGISPKRVTATGVGSFSDEFYLTDGGPEKLDPAIASKNRRVIARLTCP